MLNLDLTNWERHYQHPSGITSLHKISAERLIPMPQATLEHFLPTEKSRNLPDIYHVGRKTRVVTVELRWGMHGKSA